MVSIRDGSRFFVARGAVIRSACEAEVISTPTAVPRGGESGPRARRPEAKAASPDSPRAAPGLLRVCFLVLLLLTPSIAYPAGPGKECSKPKLYVRVAFVQGLDRHLNSDYPYKDEKMWASEISSVVVREVKARAGDVEVIPLEETVFYDDNPKTHVEENGFNERVQGEYHLDFSLCVITTRNEFGVRDDSLHPSYWAIGEIGDADLDGKYLRIVSFEHPDLYKAISSTIELMMPRGLRYLIERYETTHFNALRDPEMKLEAHDPKFVSPEPDEQKVRIKVETKDCREKFGEGTNLWFPSENERGEMKPVKESKQFKKGKTWEVETTKDGLIEIEYTLKRGEEPTRESIDVKIIGRGQKEMHQVVFFTAKALLVEVEPEEDRIAPGDQTRVLIRLLKVDEQGVKEPVKGRDLTLKVTGLEDGKVEPEDEVTTDENGVGKLTYTAGEKDKTVKIEASYKPENYETTFKGEAEINAGAYTCTVDLDYSEPYAPDGRMAVASLGMHVVFDEVFFGEAAPEDFLGSFISMDASEGHGTFTRFSLHQAWIDGDEYEQPHFIKGPPKTIEAQLSVAMDVEALEKRALDRKKEPPQPPPPKPAKVKLVFLTSMGLMHTQWGCSSGSSAIDDFRLEFEAPAADLLAGRPVTLRVPYEDGSDGKGTWTITFTPKNAE